MPDPRAASEATSSGVPEDPRAGSLGDPGTRTRTETHPGNPGAIAGRAFVVARAMSAGVPPRRGRDGGGAGATRGGGPPGPRSRRGCVPSRDDAKRARTDADAPADADADANADAHRAHPDADPSTSAGYGVAVAASEEWARALLDRRDARRASKTPRIIPSRRPGPGRTPSEGEGPQTSTRDASHAASPSSSRAAVRAAAPRPRRPRRARRAREATPRASVARGDGAADEDDPTRVAQRPRSGALLSPRDD